jgi:hypothetical protein
MKLTEENPRTRGKTCPSATPSTTNPTWNPGLRDGRPATNHLSHGTALSTVNIVSVILEDLPQNLTTSL